MNEQFLKKLKSDLKEKAESLVILIGEANEAGYDVQFNESFFPTLQFDDGADGSSDQLLVIKEKGTGTII